jgi:MATE family multidrug resistance protein
VGNLVGAQYPYAARTSAKTAMTMSTVIGFFNMGLLILLRKRWGRLFSSDEMVVAIVADVIPLVGVFQVTDCITGAAMGVLRGTGLAVRDCSLSLLFTSRVSVADLASRPADSRCADQPRRILGHRNPWVSICTLVQRAGQLTPARLAVLSYTAIGLALTFSRLHWQLYGLWSGLTIALTFTAIVGSIVVARINWPQIVKDAKDRNLNLGGGGH